MITILAAILAFIAGRMYERKQCRRIVKKRSTQDILGVFHDNKR